MKIILSLITYVCWWSFSLLHAQVLLHPNHGQWHSNALYKVELDMGEMYIEGQGVTFNLFDYKKPHSHDSNGDESHSHDEDDDTPDFLQHVIKTHFIGSQQPSSILEREVQSYYRNYFLGSDTTKWKTDIHSVQNVRLKDVYSGIDVEYVGTKSALKYSFYLSPGLNHTVIQIAYDGMDELHITKKGELVVRSTLGEIRESAPKAWTVDRNGKRSEVECAFRLDKNTLSFELGQYNQNDTLVIDPELTFSTFTGATSDNWGFTACPDRDGNLYGGGIVFGTGYPITAGVFDPSFNGGQTTGGSIPGFDISITKFNPSGTSNLYSTFLGGSGNETPNSIVTNNQGELFVLAVTSSTNFPTTAGAVQSNFAGGTTTTQYLTFSGTDLAISRISPGGNTLIASTYLGGSSNDGLNYDSNLKYNYGDPFRGEIIVDDASNVYFSSTTKSSNFQGASGSLSGQQDAIYGKLNSTLTNLLFCRYLGGTGFETGNSIQLSLANDLYVTGGTSSGGVNLGAGGLRTTPFGGIDAYVVRLNSTTGAVMNGTYLGTNAYDQGYFVQLDIENKVYVMGQSGGSYPLVGGVYGVPNSGQFIHKLSQDLMTTEWSTTFGAGNGTIQLSPTAFLVSDCYDIYFSGWGGSVNATAVGGVTSTAGIPVTSDAFQSTSNGSNFYIGVFAKDAESLKYGSYIGGDGSANHVDGGTSRFDKSGTIYHAVCASCGPATQGFTVTPGVYSTTVGSLNCNLAAFKFDLNVTSAAIGNASVVQCFEAPVLFVNTSSNANSFYWNFGDGNSSTDFSPTHLYDSPGVYNVSLVVFDENNCASADTAYFEIVIEQFVGEINVATDPVCPLMDVQLEAGGGSSYLWSPIEYLNNHTIPNPIATPDSTMIFQVIVTDVCGSDTLDVLVEVFDAYATIVSDSSLCRGETIVVSVESTSIQQIQWSPQSEFSNPTGMTSTISPENSLLISISGVSADGCDLYDEKMINVDTLMPVVELMDTVNVCFGETVTITVIGNNSYEWSPLLGISPLVGATVSLSPSVNTMYYFTATNSCGTIPDSVFANVRYVYPLAGNDTIICPGQHANLWASGGVEYTWLPNLNIELIRDSIVRAWPQMPTRYTIWVEDQYGCRDTASVFVDIFPPAHVQTSADIYGFNPGDVVEISADGHEIGEYSWEPFEFLSCPNCFVTDAYPEETTTFIVWFVNENGCKAKGTVTVYYDGILFVPNTFTPDGDQYNPFFTAKGADILVFNMKIFDRWGELIFETNDMSQGWDGTYGGKMCQDGTYVWLIDYKDNRMISNRMIGHVNLLR
jgi:gliding motility-associated-like protein